MSNACRANVVGSGSLYCAELSVSCEKCFLLLFPFCSFFHLRRFKIRESFQQIHSHLTMLYGQSYRKCKIYEFSVRKSIHAKNMLRPMLTVLSAAFIFNSKNKYEQFFPLSFSVCIWSLRMKCFKWSKKQPMVCR